MHLDELMRLVFRTSVRKTHDFRLPCYIRKTEVGRRLPDFWKTEVGLSSILRLRSARLPARLPSASPQERCSRFSARSLFFHFRRALFRGRQAGRKTTGRVCPPTVGGHSLPAVLRPIFRDVKLYRGPGCGTSSVLGAGPRAPKASHPQSKAASKRASQQARKPTPGSLKPAKKSSGQAAESDVEKRPYHPEIGSKQARQPASQEARTPGSQEASQKSPGTRHPEATRGLLGLVGKAWLGLLGLAGLAFLACLACLARLALLGLLDWLGLLGLPGLLGLLACLAC